MGNDSGYRTLHTEEKCTRLDTNTWQFTFYDEVMEVCGEVFEIKFNEK